MGNISSVMVFISKGAKERLKTERKTEDDDLYFCTGLEKDSTVKYKSTAVEPGVQCRTLQY